MFLSKGEVEGIQPPRRIQNAGGEDAMFSRQSTEHSIHKEGLMWEVNKMKDWENGLW